MTHGATVIVWFDPFGPARCLRHDPSAVQELRDSTGAPRQPGAYGVRGPGNIRRGVQERSRTPRRRGGSPTARCLEALFPRDKQPPSLGCPVRPRVPTPCRSLTAPPVVLCDAGTAGTAEPRSDAFLSLSAPVTLLEHANPVDRDTVLAASTRGSLARRPRASMAATVRGARLRGCTP